MKRALSTHFSIMSALSAISYIKKSTFMSSSIGLFASQPRATFFRKKNSLRAVL